jgi:asparagine synthase (glutamine-hydrolysing)
LAAYLLTLSGHSKGFGRSPKLLLRKAFEQQLPREVFTRKKMGFTLPFPLWLNTSLDTEVNRILRSAEFCDPKHAIDVWAGFRRGELDWSRPWALYVISRWISKNIPHSNEVKSGHIQVQPAFS